LINFLKDRDSLYLVNN